MATADAEHADIQKIRQRALELVDTATTSGDVEDIERALDAVGEWRAALKSEDGELIEVATKVLRVAFGNVTVTDAANRVGLHRTTVYRVYHPHAAA